MSSLKYGEASDTWSANPLASAAVLATLSVAAVAAEATWDNLPIFSCSKNGMLADKPMGMPCSVYNTINKA